MATGTVSEERFIALEAEVARLRARVEGERSSGTGRPMSANPTSPDFLDTMVGIHRNSPDFEEMTREIEGEREREREEARRLLAEDQAGA